MSSSISSSCFDLLPQPPLVFECGSGFSSSLYEWFPSTLSSGNGIGTLPVSSSSWRRGRPQLGSHTDALSAGVLWSPLVLSIWRWALLFRILLIPEGKRKGAPPPSQEPLFSVVFMRTSSGKALYQGSQQFTPHGLPRGILSPGLGSLSCLFWLWFSPSIFSICLHFLLNLFLNSLMHVSDKLGSCCSAIASQWQVMGSHLKAQ